MEKRKNFIGLQLIFILIFLFELYFVLKGFVAKVSPEHLLKHSGSTLRIVFFTITLLFLLGAVSKIKKIHPLALSLITILGITVLSNNTWSFIVVFWFGISSYLLGSEIYSFFVKDKKNSFFISSILLGAGIYGTLVSLIAHLPINYPIVYSALLSVPLIFFKGKLKNIYLNIQEKLRLKNDATWHDYLISALLIVYYLLALMPEVGHDALASHLFISAQIHDNHQWDFNFHNYVWAVMPALVDFIYTIGFMLAGEIGPRIMNFSAVLLIAYFVYHLRTLFTKEKNSAKLACLLFLSTPLTFLEASTLYIEAFWTLFIMLGIYEVLNISNKEGIKNSFFPIFLGLAVAAKSVSFMYFPGLVIIFIFYYKSLLRGFFTGKILAISLIGIFLASIPYIRAFYYTNNPIFPFFNGFFKSNFFPIWNFDNSLYSHGITSDFLYEVTFNTQKYLESSFAGSGFYWIFLFVPSLLFLILNFRNEKHILQIFLFALIGLIFTFFGTAYLRYIFPSYALMCACLPLVKSSSKKSENVVSIFVVLVILLNLIFIKSATNYGAINLPVIFNKDKQNEYLSTFLPIRNLIEVVNDLNTDKTPVLFLSPPLVAGLKSDALLPNWYNFRVQGAIQKINSKEEMLDFLRKENISFLVIDDTWETTAFDIKSKKLLISEISDSVHEQNNIKILKIKDQFRFSHENMINGNLNSLYGWQSDNFYPYNKKDNLILSDVLHPLTQSIEVVGKKMYRVSTLASCYIDFTQFRSQINWYDKRGDFISAAISVHDCTFNKKIVTNDFVSPANAKSGVIYLSGHSVLPIQFYSISVKD